RPIEANTPEEAIRLATERNAPDLRKVWPAAPAGAAEIICEALSPDPDSRPATARALVDELERSLGETGSSRAELAAATIPMAVVRDVEAAPEAEEPPTAEQAVVDDPVPPPPPRPEPSRARRLPPPEAPLQAPPSAPNQEPAKAARSISAGAILAVV